MQVQLLIVSFLENLRKMDLEKLHFELKKHDQEHLIQFWPTLTSEERNELDHDIKEYIQFMRFSIFNIYIKRKHAALT